MKTLIVFLLVSITALFSNPVVAQPELKRVNIGDLSTTNGDIIEDCTIGYLTIGKINSDSSNVILWPTWFDGTSENIAKRYQLTRWIDTTGLYIIVVDALSDGISSSPSNTAGFPTITIRDMVNSQYELLTRHLNIDHIYAVVGISMGGMQVYEWMVAYPDFIDKAIPVIGTPKQSSYDIFVWQTQADLINEAGPDEKDINKAMKRVYDVCYMNCYTPSFFVKKVKPEEIDIWRNKKYNYMMHSKDYLAGLNAMISHDIYKSASIDPQNISNVVKAEVLVIVSTQDHLVNPASSIDFARQFGCTLVELTGDCGHIAAWCEADKIKNAISAFLK